MLRLLLRVSLPQVFSPAAQPLPSVQVRRGGVATCDMDGSEHMKKTNAAPSLPDGREERGTELN